MGCFIYRLRVGWFCFFYFFLFDRVACIEFIYHFRTSLRGWSRRGRGSGRRKPFALNCCCTKVIKANFAPIQSFNLFSISIALLNSFVLFAVKQRDFIFHVSFLLFLLLESNLQHILVHVGKRISVKFFKITGCIQISYRVVKLCIHWYIICIYIDVCIYRFMYIYIDHYIQISD